MLLTRTDCSVPDLLVSEISKRNVSFVLQKLELSVREFSTVELQFDVETH
jgi:hypothetical protein